MFIGKILWEMYFVKLSSNHQNHDESKEFSNKTKSLSKNIDEIHFSYIDKFSHIKTYFCMACCCKFNKKPR